MIYSLGVCDSKDMFLQQTSGRYEHKVPYIIIPIRQIPLHHWPSIVPSPDFRTLQTISTHICKAFLLIKICHCIALTNNKVKYQGITIITGMASTIYCHHPTPIIVNICDSIYYIHHYTSKPSKKSCLSFYFFLTLLSIST